MSRKDQLIEEAILVRKKIISFFDRHGVQSSFEVQKQVNLMREHLQNINKELAFLIE